MHVNVGDEIELTLTDNAFGGEAVGRLEKMVVFVPYAIAGEKVRARVYRKRRRMLFAEPIEILEPSPHRTEPFCPFFGQCGGCQYQHIKYESQLEFFRKQLCDLLQRVGGFLTMPEVLPALGSPKTAHYRNRIDLHPALDGYGSPYYGFCRIHSPKEIFPLTQCKLFELDEDFSKIEFQREDKLLVLRTHSGRPYCYFKDNHNAVCSGPFDKETLEPLQSEDVYYDVCGMRFFNSYSGFFQVNTSLLETFARTVRSFAEPKSGDLLLDVYCGAGFFGLTLAKDVKEVVGIELDASSIAYAKKNAEYAGLKNCSYYADSAEHYLGDLRTKGCRPDICILDPPRTGLTNKVVSAVKHMEPRKIVYISCGPPTFARDAAKFCLYGYKLTKIQPLDLFPHTKHFELISVFEFAGKGNGTRTKAQVEAEIEKACAEDSLDYGVPGVVTPGEYDSQEE